MALRLIEIYHEKGMAKEIDFLLKDTPVIDMWHDQLPEGETITKVLLRAKDTDKVLDILQSFFSIDNKLRVVIMPVSLVADGATGLCQRGEYRLHYH